VPDKIEIQELISRYSDALTRRDWESVASVFAPDASWRALGEPGFAFEGTNIGPGIRSLIEPTNYFVQMNTPALIEVQGSQAKARSTIMEIGEYDPGKLQPFKARLESFGYYDDVVKKVNGRWLFASRQFTGVKLTVSKVED
jgi:hypothetical protein